MIRRHQKQDYETVSRSRKQRASGFSAGDDRIESKPPASGRAPAIRVEQATVFLDPLALTFPERRNRIRIISAPEATRGERKQYEEGIGEEKI